MTEIQNLLDVLQSIPLYLQLLVAVSIFGVVSMTALGAIIAWQLSGVAKAVRETAPHRGIQPAPPAQQPPPPYRTGH